MVDKGHRNQEEDESATDATGVGNENLRFLEEEYNHNHWQGNYDAPNALNDSAVVLKRLPI